MVNYLKLVSHRSILELLTAKNLLHHQKFKRELNFVFTKSLTFLVLYRLSGFLPSKILLQFWSSSKNNLKFSPTQNLVAVLEF